MINNDFRITVNSVATARLLKLYPKLANQEQNKAHRKSAATYGKKMVREVFGKAGSVFRVRRKASVRKPRKGQPKLPKKAILAGLKAEIGNPGKLHRKFLSVRTSSPLLTIRETGGTISSSKGKKLAVKVRKRGRRKAGSSPVTLRLVDSVRVKAGLRMVSRWNSLRRTFTNNAEKAMRETLRRAERQVARAGLKRAS